MLHPLLKEDLRTIEPSPLGPPALSMCRHIEPSTRCKSRCHPYPFDFTELSVARLRRAARNRNRQQTPEKFCQKDRIRFLWFGGGVVCGGRVGGCAAVGDVGGGAVGH